MRQVPELDATPFGTSVTRASHAHCPLCFNLPFSAADAPRVYEQRS
jgi:hypothetical protein